MTVVSPPVATATRTASAIMYLTPGAVKHVYGNTVI